MQKTVLNQLGKDTRLNDIFKLAPMLSKVTPALL